MKKNKALSIFAVVAWASLSHAAPIISDTFGTTGDPEANLNGRTADSGQTWSTYSQWKTSNGNATFNTTLNGMAGITLAEDYFLDNPAIYELKATINISGSVDSDDWIAIGFSEEVNTNESRGFYNTDPTNNLNSEGRPWMLLRENGAALVRSGPTSADDLVEPASGSFSSSNASLRFVYDTTLPNWTLDAFINGTQLDLNGASTGNSFSYGTNPTAIRSVGLTASAGVNGSVQDFSLTVIPEPSSLWLMAAALGALGILKRRGN